MLVEGVVGRKVHCFLLPYEFGNFLFNVREFAPISGLGAPPVFMTRGLNGCPSAEHYESHGLLGSLL